MAESLREAIQYRVEQLRHRADSLRMEKREAMAVLDAKINEVTNEASALDVIPHQTATEPATGGDDE